MAVSSLGNALSGGGGVYASDEDPELVREALPFSLKLMEAVLQETPDHQELLLSLCSGFTQYASGFVQLDADYVEDEDFEKAESLRERASKLYMRAKGYGARGLELRYPGIFEQLAEDPQSAVARFGKQDVPLLYWTGASWASAISLSLDDPEKVGELGFVALIMERALGLDGNFDSGALHSFFIQFEMSRLDGQGDPMAKAQEHFERAIELSNGQLASVYLSFAESVAVERQDKELFLKLVNQALTVDVDAIPDWRLSNLLYQERARWLLERLDWLFL
jgi:predicted anti-sigma-YlaC factor YlaD